MPHRLTILSKLDSNPPWSNLPIAAFICPLAQWRHYSLRMFYDWLCTNTSPLICPTFESIFWEVLDKMMHLVGSVLRKLWHDDIFYPKCLHNKLFKYHITANILESHRSPWTSVCSRICPRRLINRADLQVFTWRKSNSETRRVWPGHLTVYLTHIPR